MSLASRLFGESRAINSLDLRPAKSVGVRDPVASTQQITYQSAGTIQVPEWDSDAAIREAYLSSVIVFACIRTRAYAFAGCPLRAVLPGRKIADHDANAPLAKLLGPTGRPNSIYSARKMLRYALAMKLTTGFSAWELEKPQGATGKDWTPVGIWPLVNRVLRPMPSAGGTELFSAFQYGRSGDLKILSPDQVYFNFEPSPNDLRQPFSPLQPARYDITADVLQSVYDVAFLRNDARPAGVLVHEAFEEDGQTRAFRQQFESQHRGPQNANRLAFAEAVDAGAGVAGAMQWINMGISQKDAQMLATHNEKAMRICIDLQTPMSLLDASGRTFNNAGLEIQNFWLDTMLPDLQDWADDINMHLAPRLGPHIAMFDTSHVKALEPPVKYTPMSLGEAFDRRICTASEARMEIGLVSDIPPELVTEPASSGETLTERVEAVKALVASGWTPQEAAKIAGLPPPAAIAAPDPVVTPFAVLPGGAAPAAVPQSVVPPSSAADAHAITLVRGGIRKRGERKRIWQQQQAHNAALEAAWAKGLRRLFARQQSATLKRVEARSGRWAKALATRDGEDPPPDDWTGDVFDPTFWTAETEAAVIGLYESLYAAGGATVAGMFGLTYDINDPRVEAQIAGRASKLAGQVTGTTFDAIQRVIRQGIAAGSGIPTISKGIEDVFAQADSARATLIARTEVIRASADGAMSAWDQAVRADLIDPTQYGKTWIATDDSRECIQCAALDGETVAFDEQFSNAEDGPPDHPDCRCTIGVDTLDSARGIEPDHVVAVLRAVAARTITAQELTA